MLLAWFSGLIFVAVQGYLAFNYNCSYRVALVSFVGEVVGLLLHFALPAISGLDYLIHMDARSVLEETKGHIGHLIKFE